NHATLIRASALIKNLHNDLQFVLSGEGVNSEQAELVRQIRDLRLQSRVHLLGERNDVPRITAALDIATLCSLAEAFPNSLAEAMACGIACVATDVGDSKWIMGHTGRVV